MKKILLLSDTHGYIDDKIVNYALKADEIWHAGDIGKTYVIDMLESLKPLRAVYGNIDGYKIRLRTKKVLSFNCEEVKVIITHIAGYPERYNSTAKKLIQAHQPKLFISGHSHILKVIRDKNYGHLYMNPGASGNVGFHHKRTMLLFEIDKDIIKNLKVVELGTRNALSDSVDRSN